MLCNEHVIAVDRAPPTCQIEADGIVWQLVYTAGGITWQAVPLRPKSTWPWTLVTTRLRPRSRRTTPRSALWVVPLALKISLKHEVAKPFDEIACGDKAEGASPWKVDRFMQAKRMLPLSIQFCMQ